MSVNPIQEKTDLLQAFYFIKTSYLGKKVTSKP